MLDFEISNILGQSGWNPIKDSKQASRTSRAVIGTRIYSYSERL